MFHKNVILVLNQFVARWVTWSISQLKVYKQNSGPRCCYIHVISWDVQTYFWIIENGILSHWKWRLQPNPSSFLLLYHCTIAPHCDMRPVNLHPLFLFWKHGSVCDPEKKSGPKYGMQKAGCIKQGHCYSKREEARLYLFERLRTE